MSSKKRDYYEVLGVNKNASEADIKKAYRKKAMQYHPDRYEGDKTEAEELFKEVNEAYEILSDPDKRARYDRFGFAGLEGFSSRAASADPFEFFNSIFNFDLGSIFGSGFGGGTRSRARRGPTNGDDVILDLELSLEDAYTGVSKKIKMPYNKPCPSCLGSRAEPGSGMVTCKVCHGNGIVEDRVSSGFFVQISQKPCNNCKGSGQVPKTVCKTCKGSGYSNKREEITVRIPRGIDEGEAVRVQGKGRPSNNGGMPGDLIFRIHLKEHKTYVRHGNDVYMEMPIPYPILVLGGEINVPIISGKDDPQFSKLKIPSGTQLKDVITLSNKGFVRNVRGNSVTGNMYYIATVEIPKKPSKKEKEIIEQLKNELNSSN